jgi:hypothetical protein
MGERPETLIYTLPTQTYKEITKSHPNNIMNDEYKYVMISINGG